MRQIGDPRCYHSVPPQLEMFLHPQQLSCCDGGAALELSALPAPSPSGLQLSRWVSQEQKAADVCGGSGSLLLPLTGLLLTQRGAVPGRG